MKGIRKAFCCSAAQLDSENVAILTEKMPELCRKLIEKEASKGKKDSLLISKMIEKGKITRAEVDAKVIEDAEIVKPKGKGE
jgi:hypothetical protein